MLAQTLLPDFPSQLGSWKGIYVPTTKAFLGDESSLLPRPAGWKPRPPGPWLVRLSESPSLLCPLLGSPAVLGTGLPQAPIYACVWVGVGRGTCGGQRVAVFLSCFPLFLLLFVSF